MRNYRAEAQEQAALGWTPAAEQEYSRPEVAGPIGGMAKRVVDIAIALALLPFAVVLGLPIALLVSANGGRPIFGHLRIGHDGRAFRCYKFRTMVRDAEERLADLLRDENIRRQWNSQFKLDDDPRVTRIGSLLRRTGLDEIPQLWNVLSGDMSWVGPRPVTERELGKYGPDLPAYLACRPGVTGPWQITRNADTTYSERVLFDVNYVEQWSMAADLRILLRTVPALLRGTCAR